MKLEFKHLAPYLPYGLTNKRAFHTPQEIDGVVDNLVYFGNSSLYLSQIEPILIPISFFGKMVIKNIKDYLDCSHDQVMEVLKFMNNELKADELSYGTFNKLAAKHIDLFDLIPNGLAVEKNHSPV